MPNNLSSDAINKELANQYMRACGLVIKLSHIIKHNKLSLADDSIKEADIFINQNDHFYRAAIDGFTEQRRSRIDLEDTPPSTNDFI